MYRAVLGLVALLAVGAGQAPADATLCARAVSGGSAAERAAVGRVLCLMPGTSIRAVQLLDQPPDAPAGSAWVAFTIPRDNSVANAIQHHRAVWEAGVAAGAIRDGFGRLGLRRVVAYQVLLAGETPSPARLYWIALRGWGVQWLHTVPLSPALGKGVGTWAELQARLDRLAQRWHVVVKLERYNPFGKAPVVTVTTPRPGEFVNSGAQQQFLRALRFRQRQYDGVLFQIATGGRLVVQLTETARGRPSDACTSALPAVVSCHH